MNDLYIKNGANSASYMIDQLDSVINTYEEAKESYTFYSDLQQDLLHQIEWSSSNACDGYKLYKQLKKCRIKRRVAEMQIEVLEPLYTLLKTKGNFKKQLEKAKYECSIKSKSLNKRGYHCRTGEVDQEELTVNASKFQSRIKDITTNKKAKLAIWS